MQKSDSNSLVNFVGKCWCDNASYLDFFNPQGRQYYKQAIIQSNNFLFESYKNIFIWNDMNEPSVFDQDNLTLPKLAKFEYYNNTYSHREAHNLYGFFMQKASFDALKERYKKRPFVLTRAFYIGSHKYGATWTGDMSAKWEDIKLSVPMILSNSVSGFSFIGADVGGFYKENDVSLFTRWYQLGVFYPFFRAHSHNETYRREPWLYDHKTLNLIRNSVRIRYFLMPYIYLTFYQYHQSGLPIARPLFFKYNSEEAIKKLNEQFFFGDHLMIRPVLTDNENYFKAYDIIIILKI